MKNDGENCISTIDPDGNMVVALYNGGENPSDNPGTETVQLNIAGLEDEYCVRAGKIRKMVRCISGFNRKSFMGLVAVGA